MHYSVPFYLKRFAKLLTAYLSSGAIVVTSILPAYADVVATPDGAGGTLTDTTIAVSGNTSTVTTGTISSGVALNAFNEFSIENGKTVELVQPGSTNALVNVVNDASGTPSSILGTLNTRKAGDATGVNSSKVFIVDHNGFVVGSTGTINANTLILSTAKASVGSQLIAGDSTAMSDLMAGSEELDPNADIEFQGGSNVNVAALELHVGAELILNGTISVDAPGQEGTSVPVAVNSSHLTKARGASVQGGVIHFGAKKATIGGTVRAKRGGQGGQISGRVSESLKVASGAVLDVSGMSFDGGSILFGGETVGDFVGAIDTALTFEAGAQIDASSSTATGGFFFARAGSLGFGGDLDLAGGGAALLEARTNATFTGATTTNGGDFAVLSDVSINISAGASIDTTSADVAGDISLIGTDIAIGSGAMLNADVVGTDKGGLVALIAAQSETEVGFPISDQGATAQIAITGATVKGGAVVVSAYAKTANVVDATNAASVEAQNSAAEDNDGIFTTAFNDLTSQIADLATKGKEAFSKKFPIQFKDIDATAVISITNSTVEARGNWKGAAAPDATDLLTADNGILHEDGLQTRNFTALLGKPLTAMAQLPNAFNATTDSLYIHANSETEIDIKPLSYLLSTAAAVTDTKSTVRIEGSTLSATAGDAVMNSSVQDNLNIDLLGNGIKGVAVTAVVATHNSVNQLLVLDGSVTASAGDISAAAVTGKTHKLSNRVGAGDGGISATAVTVSVGSSFTEAALGGALTAQNLDLDAETIYFEKSHETKATLGDASAVSDAVPTSAASLAAKVGAAKAKQAFLNDDDEDPTKNKLGIGLAVDIQLDTNRTYASLGGRYRDLTGGDVERAMSAATVNVGSTVTVDATQRFARFDEGGAPIERQVHAQMQDLNSFLSRLPDAGGNTSPPTGGTDVALFGAMSMSQMAGATRAEIGDGAVVNADAVTVDALTEYQTVSNLTNFRDRWRFFTNELTKIDAAGTLTGNPSTIPDLNAATDGIVLITTSVGTKSLQSSTALNDQKFAMGASVNLFETDNDTEALIGDGAVITVNGDVNVTAKQEALFTHMAATAEGGSKLAPTGTPSNLVGANVSVPRMLSRVVAEVGNATINAGGDLNILAENDVIQLGVVRSSGSAAKAAINGAIAANIFETVTIARLGETASVTAQNLKIDAEDSSLLVSLAGTKSGGTNIGVGASAVINLIKRDTRAEIGNVDVATLAINDGQSITAQTIDIRAANTGVIFGSALAGSKVAGTAAGSAAAGAQDNDQSPSVPGGLLDANETAAVSAQNNVSSAPDATGATRASGFAVSGSVVLNLFQQNDVTAGISTNSTVAAVNSADVLAENTALDIGLAGSVAVGLGLDLGANALAGAVALKKDTRNTRVILNGATITGLTVTSDARDAARSVNVAVSGSGGKSTLAALAGSVTTNIEGGETLVQITDATITTTVSQSFIARNQGQLFGIAGGVSVSVGGLIGVGLSVATNNSSRDAKVLETGSTLTAPVISLSSLSELEVYGIAASGGLAKLSLGGSAVANTVSGSAITRLQNARVNGGDVSVSSASANELWAYTGNLTVAGTAAVGGAISINQHDGGAQAIVRNSVVTGQNITVGTNAQAELTGRALALASAATGAVGIGIAVNTSAMNVLADIDGSDLLARGNIAIGSNATANVSGLTLAGTDGGSVAASGTATYNEANNIVQTLIRDQSGATPSRLFAKGSVAVTSAADTNVELLGGRDSLPNVNGNITASGTAGIGASITINTANNQVNTVVVDEASIQGFGAGTVTTRLGARRGVLIDAYASTDVDAMAISAGVAGTAALTGIFVYNTVSDDVAVTVGDGLDAKINTVTGLDAALSSEISGTVDIFTELGGTEVLADAGQDVRISGAVSNSIDNFALAVAAAGSAAVGAAGSGNLIDSTAVVTTNTATINAKNDIDIDADIYSRLTTYSFGASGGKAAGSASVTYNAVRSAALVNLIGTGLSAGGAVSVTSNVESDLSSFAGNLAAGGGAGAGSVVVNILATTSEVRTTATTVARYNVFNNPAPGMPAGAVSPTYVPGYITAGGNVTINARTENIVSNSAVSGAVGGGFVAISAAINLVESQTKVVIGPDYGIDGTNIAIDAIEQTRLSDLVGVIAGGGAGVGGSLNYVDFTGNSSVVIGARTRVIGSGTLRVNAQADRDVDGMVGMASLVAGSSLSAVISIINVGGKAVDGSGKGDLILNQTATALADDPTASSGDGSLGDMSARSGATGSIAALDADRTGADVAPTGARVDNVGVVLGTDAQLIATGTLDVLAQNNTGIEQTVGVVAAGTAALSAAVGVTNLKSKASIQIHSGARVISDDVITIEAGTAARPGENSVDSTIYSVAAGVGLTAAAGVSIANANTQTDVSIADGVRIGTATPASYGDAANSLNQPAKVNIRSTRADTLVNTITNFGLSGAAAVGVAYAEANNNGSSAITIGSSTGLATVINSGNVSIDALDISRVSSTTTSAQGGTLAGVSGAFSLTTNTSSTTVQLRRTAIEAATFALNNVSSARSLSEADGLALGALAIGVTIADASFNASLITDLNAVAIDAIEIEILTEVKKDGSDTNVVADALAGSGGVVAGGGAVARALSSYNIQTTIDGGTDSVVATHLNAANQAIIRTNATNFDSLAVSSGLAVGALAVGVVIGEVGQKGTTGAVLTDVRSGTISGIGGVFIASDNTQIQTVDVTSGSGGLISGAGAVAKTYVNAKSETRIGETGNVLLIAGDPLRPEDTRFNGELTVMASQDATLGSRMDNTSASAVGFSGAVASTNINSDVDVIIGGNTDTIANFYTISAFNALNRPLTSNGIKSASGGGLVGAAISSDVNGAVNTDVTIQGGANMVQVGDPNLSKGFRIGAEANLRVQDILLLDAGGVLAVPVGENAISITQNGSVNIGVATLRATGKLDIYSGANTTIKAETHSTSYGLAGAASSKSYATYAGTNSVNILPNADLLSFTDIALRAGQGSGGEQRVDVDAEARSFNKTAIPIDIDPVANAASNVQANVNIGVGSKVIAYQDIDLIATAGRRDIRGFGLGKDFYKAILEGAASLVGASLVLDIEKGNTVDIGNGTVSVNGEVRSGAFNRRVLYLDDNDVLNNGLLETMTDSGIYESNADAPDPSLYRVEQNVDLSIGIQARIDDLDALIADPNTAADDKARYQASRVILIGRLNDLGGQLSSVITVDYLRASEGSVRIESDVLTGSATGSLYAASEADIRVYSTSGAQLNINGLEISDVEGGDITFNEALIEAGTSDYAFGVSFGQVVDGKNVVSVITNRPQGGPPNTASVGNIDIIGAVASYSGDVVFNTEEGSITQSAPVSAENFSAAAPKGSINIGPNEGIDNRGGSPTITYRGYVNGAEGYSNFLYNLGVQNNVGRNDYFFARSGRIATNAFGYLAPQGFTTAGRSISLLAEYTNINTLLRAGTGSYVVDIAAGIDGLIAGLKAQGGTGRVRLDNLASQSRNGVIRTGFISDSTNADIYYNYETDQIEIDDMKVRGGSIYIVSNVISTGFGALEAVDGFGSLTLNSDAQTDVVLNSIDLGGSANGAALEGLVRITDLSKFSNYTGGGARPFLTTDYRSIGGFVSVYDNNALSDGSSGEETIEDAFGNDIIRPARLISGPVANGSFTYTPVQNRDYVAVTEKTRLVKMDQFDVAIVQGSGAKVSDPLFSQWYRTQKIPESDAGIISGSENIILSASFSDPLVRYSLGGSDYAYAYDHTRSSYRLGQGARSYSYTDYNGKTHVINLNPSLHGLADQVFNPVDDRTTGVNEGFTRFYNIWPGNQSFYSLIYEIEPGLRSSERELNIRHKLIDKRSALFVETERHEHRFKADYGIGIRFSGSRTAGTNITANGDVILSKDLFNRFGSTAITSQTGSILSAQNSVQISAADLDLTATNGSIGGIGGPLRLDLTKDTNTSDNVITPGQLSAVAGQGIDVFEISGDLHIKKLQTTQRGVAEFGAQIGGISVKAQGDVIQTGNATAFEGSDISLTSLSGGIYRDGVAGPEALQIDTEFGRLDASAQDDITVQEVAGDLGLGTVTSITGNVTLDVPLGRALDRNNVEVRDTRTLAELNTLWSTELALTAGTTEYAARRAAQIAAYENQFTHAYQTYWQKRNAAGGAGTVVFALDPTVEADMRASSLSDAAVDKHIADYQALYATWNSEGSFNAGYTYTASSAEIAALTEGSIWTVEDLTTSIRAGLVLETGDTNVRLENPNIVAAGDITITARDGIGEIRDPYVLVKPAPGASLTANDIAVLARADKDDFDIDGDGTPDLDANGNSLIRQEEDLNFAFSEDVNGRATGALKLTSAFNEIYLAAETAAEINKLHGTGDVELRVDGIMTNAEVETFAVAGQNVLLESGSANSIGEASKALTVNILPGGTLTARSGTDIYIEAPSAAGIAGDIPVAALFAGDLLSLTAAGAITDAVGSGLERVVAGSLEVTAASIGTAGSPLGIAVTDHSTGSANITSTVGDINVFTARAFALNNFNSAASGSLTTTNGAALTLSGAGPITFAGNTAFKLDLDGSLDVSGVKGPAITGQTLDVVSRIGFGSAAEPLTTQVANLNFAPSVATDPLSVWFSNTGDLSVGTFSQTTSTASESHIATTGNLTLGSITTAGLLDLESGATLDLTSADAHRLEMLAGTVIGGSSAMALSVNELDLRTIVGNARAVLTGRNVAIERADVGGAGSVLDLTITGVDAVVRGAGVTSAGAANIAADGALSIAANTDLTAATSLNVTTQTFETGSGASLTADAINVTASRNVTLGDMSNWTAGQIDIKSGETLSVGVAANINAKDSVKLSAKSHTYAALSRVFAKNGALMVEAATGELSFAENAALVTESANIDVRTAGDIHMAAASEITSDTGTIALTVGGDLTAEQISTGNATDTALSVTVGGAVNATTATKDVLVANAQGALTTLQAGSVPATGQEGLNVALNRLNARVETGDLHLHEAGTVMLENITIAAGALDIFASQNVVVGKVTAANSIIISSAKNVKSDNAMFSAPETYLFAFGGSIQGVTGDAFAGDVATGSTLNLHARDDVRYKESIGSAKVGYALATLGDLSLSTQQTGAAVTVDTPGAGGSMTLSSNGDVTVNAIDETEIDLIDETARALVYRGANPYGVVEVVVPKTLVLRASGPGSKLTIGSMKVTETVDLQADIIDASLTDLTPDDGLNMNLSGVDGATAQLVKVDLLTSGAARLQFGRFMNGEITTSGSALSAADVIVTREAWFRQKTFDLYTNSYFGGVNLDADAQILALEINAGTLVAGNVSFDLFDDRQIATEKLVINRKLADVGLNGIRSFFEGALTELVQNLTTRGSRAEKTELERLERYLQFLGETRPRRTDVNTLVLPLILARN